MAVPKRRTSRSKRNMRRANHDKVTPVQLVACANCGEPTVPHRVCGSCGHYKGREVKPSAATATDTGTAGSDS